MFCALLTGLLLNCLMPGSMTGQLLPPSHSTERLPEIQSHVEVEQDLVRRELIFKLIDLRDHAVIDSFYSRSVRWTTGRIDLGDSDQLAYRLWLHGGSNSSYEQLIILTIRNGQFVTSLNLQSYERFFLGEFIERRGPYFYGRDSIGLECKRRNGTSGLVLKQDVFCIENDKADVRQRLNVPLKYDVVHALYYSDMIRLSQTPDGISAGERLFHAVRLRNANYVCYNGEWYWYSQDLSEFGPACYCTTPYEELPAK